MYEIITNKILVIPASAWAVAQLIKMFIGLAREKRLNLRYMVGSGGVLSAHSTIVCALATSVAMTMGLGSVAFGIATVLAIVVMYDATVERQEVGQQSVILNRIIQELRFRRPMAELERDLREFIGHSPFQVFAGASLGIFIAWLWLTISGV